MDSYDHSASDTGLKVPLGQHARKPVRSVGALEQFDYEDLTPAIGREFRNVNIVDDLMNAENSEDRLRDLALMSEPLYELISTYDRY